MTPAINFESNSLLQSETNQAAHKHQHQHHADTADLLMQHKEAQRLLSLEILQARQQHEQDQAADQSILAKTAAEMDAVQGGSDSFHDPCGPFEGPEKLLELWFAEEPADVHQCAWDGPDARPGHFGLRSVPKPVWETMLDIVKCKVLSVIESTEVDAYLLSESSMFVFPHKLILKTCGTTTLLLGLERLLTIANQALAALPKHVTVTPIEDDASSSCSSLASTAEKQLGSSVLHAFYSRKSFMFPERQKGPHRDWMLEVAVLDRFFDYGAAYTVGKMNGDHWLLWMGCEGAREASPQIERPLQLPAPCVEDQTLEILMTHLSPNSCARFNFDPDMAHPTMGECYPKMAGDDAAKVASSLDKGHALGLALSNKLGLTTLFPETELDAFAFEPCGYSANALMPRGGKRDNAGYWTIHVTPEEHSSYASFETNVALDTNPGSSNTLPALVSRIVQTFEPGKMSVTLFVSSDNDACPESNGDVLHKLQLKGYKRTDRIAYEFERYDLVFVSFEKRCSSSMAAEADR